jgi:hypothetical protein
LLVVVDFDRGRYANFKHLGSESSHRSSSVRLS